MGQRLLRSNPQPIFIDNISDTLQESYLKGLCLGMDLTQLQALCMSFPHATEDIKWEHDLCFSIGGKMFLVTGADGFPVSASLKVTEDEFEEWSAKPGCKPAPYMARHKWIYIEDIARFPTSEIKRLAQQSYELVKAKLAKKTLREISN
jgi:predicted DNA-binding protein (MmcQ/YjbR family)